MLVSSGDMIDLQAILNYIKWKPIPFCQLKEAITNTYPENKQKGLLWIVIAALLQRVVPHSEVLHEIRLTDLDFLEDGRHAQNVSSEERQTDVWILSFKSLSDCLLLHKV